ncbi:MAG: PEGA domain-containing protein [Planctomycetaceae bacterium]
MSRFFFPRRLVAALVVACFCWSSSGCMHRRMTIATNPPGARVLVDGQDVGLTPVSADFTYYGTRQITLIKDGYETRTVMQRVRTPWYQIPPFDFVSDNFLPFKVTNRHFFQYDLDRQQQVPRRELLDRARDLRSEAHLGQ